MITVLTIGWISLLIICWTLSFNKVVLLYISKLLISTPSWNVWVVAYFFISTLLLTPVATPIPAPYWVSVVVVVVVVLAAAAPKPWPVLLE